MKNKTFKASIILLLAVLFTDLSTASLWNKCLALFEETDEIKNKVIKKKVIGETVIEDKTSFISEYKGQENYLRFTEELKRSKKMDYVFIKVAVLLSQQEMKSLGWKIFIGTATEYRIKILGEQSPSESPDTKKTNGILNSLIGTAQQLNAQALSRKPPSNTALKKEEPILNIK